MMVAGGFVVIIAAVFIGLGFILIAAFVAIKAVHDIRMRLLADAKTLFDEHFLSINKLASDPATPPYLYASIVSLSEHAVKDEKFGRRAADHFFEMKSPPDLASNPAALEVLACLDELERHRPDLAFSFQKAATAGLFAAAFRHIAREMSPIRAYREAGVARQAQKANTRVVVSQAIGEIQPHSSLGCAPA